MAQLRIVNVIVHVQALGVLAQAVLAGFMLENVADAATVHALLGDTLPLVALLQLVVAIVARRSGAPRWVAAGSAVLLVGQAAIVGAGHAAVLALHVPLATALLGVAVWMIVALVGRGGALRSAAEA